MREIDNFLHKESAKLYQLLRDVQENRKVQEKVWDDFCKKTNEDVKHKKTYFKKHPKNISSSSSEILTPRANKVSKVKKSPKGNRWKAEISSDEKSQSSLDIVTVRQEISVVRNEYVKKVYGKPPTREESDRRALCAKPMTNRAKSIDTARGGVQRKALLNDKKSEPKKHADKSQKSRDLTNDLHIESKLNRVLDKTLKCMEDIRMHIDAGLISPDYDDDLDRRRKRSVEFASRFSRNYLYQLNRQVNDILQTTSQLNGNITSRTASSLRKKLIASYQTLLQGLQAYYNHLPISTTNAVPDKVRELLKLTFSLCEIHRICTNKDLNSNLEKDKLVDVFEVRSKCLLDKINEKFFCPSSASLMNCNAIDGYQVRSDNHRHNKRNNKNRSSNSTNKNRYAMYAMAPLRRDEAWKKACAILAKKKFNVPSKYKTANFKHRPPVEKDNPIPKQQLKPSKLVEKKSSGRIKPKAILNDDNIQTMVQWHSDKDADALNFPDQTPRDANLNNSPANVESKQDILANLIGQVMNTITDDRKEVNQQQVKNILQGFLEYVGGAQDQQERVERQETLEKQEKPERKEPEEKQDETSKEEQKEVKWSNVENFDTTILEKVVNAVKRNQESIKKAKEVCEQNTKEDVQEKKKPDRKKSITVTGVKNAQLICIKDEDSATEISEKEECPKPTLDLKKKQSRHSNSNKDQEKNVQPTSSPSDLQIQRNCSERVSKIKISRLPRGPLRPLKMLPKKCALEILEYKLNYVKARKGNHMYKKSATKQPWVLMGEIADKILDELIQGVGSEIQVNGVIDSIYASEFAQ